MGYLIGETKAPKSTNPAYATWDVENSMVMRWFVNSMEEDINSIICSIQRHKSYGKTSIKCTMIWEISLKFLS